ncbi:MAG TPA: endonuclease III [Candidatus Desulfovibrio intestinipullorum]|uniref:Endonuclease III n=1 Tax=Candidatus Desulfovibrio intestinipullorum TaxID=2838536 RepID=A0A9D1PWX2_9BACT|nr:endonuclease III [Candidatus Desulfovibrio intestinipullorum]
MPGKPTARTASARTAKTRILPEGAAERAPRVLSLLKQRYPHPDTVLVHASPWQLLVATVLAAQCTDERVNKVTPAFFSRWPTPRELSCASVEEIEEVIKSTGFYHNKAKNLLGAARLLMEKFNGEPPRTMAELVTVPGVARKTANIVLFGGYGINEGMAVDTHVKRISHRLGLTAQTDPVRVERNLMELFERCEWGDLNHRMVQFGRDVCNARSPHCDQCEMASFCPKLEPAR